MGLFEFLMILISVVVGLALTELLSGAAQLLRDRDTVRFHWLHILFQIGVFFALLQQWWESWDLVNVTSVTFGSVLSLLLPSVVLFLIAHLMFPKPAKNADLEAYYYRQAPILWGLVFLGTLHGTFIEAIMQGTAVFQASNLTGIPILIICAILILNDRKPVHSILAPIIMLLVIFDTWWINPAISA